MGKTMSRRSLLRKAAALAGAAAGARLARGPLIWAGEAPSSKLGIVVIGAGGRGTSSHLPVAAGERLVAIVDVDEKSIAKAMKFLADKYPTLKTSGVKTYFDYRKMFDEAAKDLDAVSVATPNHHHCLPAMIAMKLGKGAFVEKPMSHSIHEARAMAEAARKCKVPTQMGNQGHCAEGYRRLCESGAIGKVTEVHCWSDRANGGTGGRPPSKPVPPGMHWEEWIGPSPYRDYHADLHPHEWHGWWDFGNGSLGNMACHVMDGAVWALKLTWPNEPASARRSSGTART